MPEWQHIQQTSIVKVITVIMGIIDNPLQVQFQSNRSSGNFCNLCVNWKHLRLWVDLIETGVWTLVALCFCVSLKLTIIPDGDVFSPGCFFVCVKGKLSMTNKQMGGIFGDFGSHCSLDIFTWSFHNVSILFIVI